MARFLSVVVTVVFGLIVVVTGAVAAVLAAVTSGSPSGPSSAPSEDALGDIPADYLALYQQAAPSCPGLDWAVLAAIGKIETDHGRLQAPGVASGENAAGAAGPMQFLAPTFAEVVAAHPSPPGGATPPSRYDPHDAVHAAAAYLCDNGARNNDDLYGAIFTYNRADWYVRNVLDQAEQYRTTPPNPASGGGAGGWVHPLLDGQCTSGFGYRDGEFHRGQDLAAPVGTPIRAAQQGRVLDAGPASGYGLWVRIQHPDGTITTYGHNHQNHVRAGEQVQAGQHIAAVGNRGQSTGPHLHFQIDRNGEATDPGEMLPDLCGE